MAFNNETMSVENLPTEEEMKDDNKRSEFVGQVNTEMYDRGYSWLKEEGGARKIRNLRFENSMWKITLVNLELVDCEEEEDCTTKWIDTEVGINVTVEEI